MGYFNINFSKYGDVPNYANKLWDEIILRYDLKQIIKLPTRITNSSSTIIDHMYTTRSDVISDVHVPALCISNHFPICFTRNTNKIKIKKHQHQTIMYRLSESHFLTDLSKSHIELVESVSNPNEALEMFF